MKFCVHGSWSRVVHLKMLNEIKHSLWQLLTCSFDKLFRWVISSSSISECHLVAIHCLRCMLILLVQSSSDTCLTTQSSEKGVGRLTSFSADFFVSNLSYAPLSLCSSCSIDQLHPMRCPFHASLYVCFFTFHLYYVALCIHASSDFSLDFPSHM